VIYEPALPEWKNPFCPACCEDLNEDELCPGCGKKYLDCIERELFGI